MALTVSNASTSKGANVQVNQYNGSSGQKWSIYQSNGSYRIKAKCSGYFLDITAYDISAGTNIEQWSEDSSGAQNWVFIPYNEEIIEPPTGVLPDSIGLIQQTSVTCTLASAAMMLRARMYRSANDNWASVTENSIKSVAWCDDGLYYNWTYSIGGNSMTVAHKTCNGMSADTLKGLLDSHPEGIVLYERAVPHAIFVCDYVGDTFYCFDPARANYSGRRTLSNSYLATCVGNQASILSGADDYWYVSSYSITPTGPHTHDWVFEYYWDAHPHHNSYKCSICGEIWVDNDSSNYLTSCDDCRPGKPAFIGLSGIHNAGEPVTFSWNPTEHTTHYNFWIYKEDDEGGYYTVDHRYEVSSGFQMNLGVGKYKAELQSYDDQHWLSDHSDWAYSESDPTYFEVQTAYTVSYDANGGTGAPDSQIKIQGVDLSLSSTEPTREDTSAGSYTVNLNANVGSASPTSLNAARTTSYSFKNWNTAADGSGTSYASGARYTANADVTLYAQWNSNTTTSAVTLPTPTRSGYTFKGWGTSSTTSSGVTGSYTPSSNVTLYAIWKLNFFTITYNANGGTDAPNAQIKTPGVALTLTTARPKYEDCLFLGWAESADATTAAYQPGDSFTKDADTTLYAVWLEPDFVLPAALTEIGEEAFAGGVFTCVKLPENTDTIGKNAFANCPNLKYIYIPEGCLWIDRYAFTGVTGLTILGVDGSYAQTYASGKGFDFIAVP